MAKKKKKNKKVTAKKIQTIKKGLKKFPATEKKPKKESVSTGIAVLAFLVNLLIFPGLGSIIGNEIKQGIIQLVLFIVGIAFVLSIFEFITGLAFILVAWVWGIVTGIQILKKTE